MNSGNSNETEAQHHFSHSLKGYSGFLANLVLHSQLCFLVLPWWHDRFKKGTDTWWAFLVQPCLEAKANLCPCFLPRMWQLQAGRSELAVGQPEPQPPVPYPSPSWKNHTLQKVLQNKHRLQTNLSQVYFNCHNLPSHEHASCQMPPPREKRLQK